MFLPFIGWKKLKTEKSKIQLQNFLLLALTVILGHSLQKSVEKWRRSDKFCNTNVLQHEVPCWKYPADKPEVQKGSK